MANRSYTTKTIKVLFGRSGNQCAHPDCANPVIVQGTEASDDAVLAQICHIYAASDNGPRGNPDLTDEERNSPDNLILLCGFHHPMVDTQFQDYPAELLRHWKRTHEAKFQPDTAEAIRRQGQVQQSAFTVKLTDQQIDAEVRHLRQARHLVGYSSVDQARALAASVENTELAGGSSALKASALAWCARILASEDLPRAKSLLVKSRDFGGSAETGIANAVVVAAEAGESAPALPLLAQIGTPESRSAMLRLVSNERGPDGALDWAQSAGLDLESFDSDGKLAFIMSEQFAGRWSDAYAHMQRLTPADFQETPVLNYAAAQAHLSKVIPEELRPQTMFQLPFNASRVPLADDKEALHDRARAIELYEKQATIAEEFGATEAARLSFEMVLWLRLRDPALHGEALEVLRSSMRDDALMLRRFPMAVDFGLNVDLDAVERRVNERVALTGKGTIDEAIARIALAMTKDAPAAVEYIGLHRNQLTEFLDRLSLLRIEIELLCRSGQIETAKATLAKEPLANLGDRERERLQRVIAEAEGADPAAERRKLYEATGELRDLVNLVSFLEQEQAWRDLCPLAEAVFAKTRSVEDALRVVRACSEAGERGRILEFLQGIPDIVARESELQSHLAWAFYRNGEFNEALAVLTSLRTQRDHISDRALFVNLAIASGQWDALVGYTTREWEQKDQRTAEELLRAGQLAQAVNGPKAKDLIVAATEVAPSDPRILAPAYFHAVSAGWETDPVVRDWLLHAAEKSGDQGPLKSMTMKELAELKPDWDRRRDDIYAALLAGQM